MASQKNLTAKYVPRSTSPVPGALPSAPTKAFTTSFLPESASAPKTDTMRTTGGGVFFTPRVGAEISNGMRSATVGGSVEAVKYTRVGEFGANVGADHTVTSYSSQLGGGRSHFTDYNGGLF